MHFLYVCISRKPTSRNPTLFPIHLWNIFHLVPQGLPRTTNLVEGWHRGLLTTCGCHHPTIWKFIEALKTEQASVELKQLRFISGENPKKTKKSIEKEKSIMNLVNSFAYRSILLYLRGISFKIPF